MQHNRITTAYHSLKSNYVVARASRSTQFRHSNRRLAKLRNIHAGKQCVIIGNGPSLKQTDLSLLTDEFTIGLNRIYLLFDEIEFIPNYYVCVNNHVLEQFADEIDSLSMPKFISWSGSEFLPANNGTYWLATVPRRKFSTDIVRQGLWQGATVTFVALQIAYHLGFRKVILIGVDHSFSTPGPANTLISSEGSDENHFHPNYFGKGVKWQLPDLEVSEEAYRLARSAYERAGGEVIDSTVDGKLDIFPKMELKDALAEPSRNRRK